MNDLLKMRLFSLLTGTSPVPNDEIQSAYVEFIEEVKFLNQSESDYQTVFRSLNLTRVELIFLQPLLEYEQGKKCAYKSIYTKSNCCN